MSRKPGRTSKPKKQSLLRTRAEASLAHSPSAIPTVHPADELLHELRAHQVKLERQNESLRQSRLALEVSRDRYADLYEFAPVGFISLTHAALIGSINLTGAALLGKDRSKLIQHRFATFVSPANRDQWHQIFTHTVQHGKYPSCELLLQRADGSCFHAQLDGLHPVNDGDSVMVRFAFTDITERHQAKAVADRMLHILDNTMDMIFIFLPDTLRFVYMNKGANKCVGYSREAMLQMTPPDILPAISEAECRAFIAPLINGNRETIRFETTLVCNEGRELPVEVQLQLVQEQDDDGLFVAIVRDIAKRKVAEQELRRQKNLMWQVIDTDPNLIFVKNSDGEFLLVNRAIAEYYGAEVKDIVGKKNGVINPDPQEAEQFLAADRKVIESGREVVLTELLVKNGKQHWYHTIKRPLLQDDGTVNVLGIAVDITELKTSKNKLAESYRELQRLSLHLENIRAEERAHIGRNLHDEMGAVLAALKMRIAWLASRLPEDMPHLRDEAKHISELVSHGILTVRQITADLRPNLLADVGLAEAVMDYVRKFQRVTEIECSVEFPDEDFSLDENQSATVFRIMQESLNNVAKHARASQIAVLVTLQDGALQLQIKDNGIGFDPDRSMRSFGLLGIRERALMIGGKAAIASAPGQGTCVSLNIPLSGSGQTELDYS